jgi:small-conductance mechanosensitive channel
MTNILDQLKHGEFANPAQPIGALVYAVVFALLAWLAGRALRLAVQRVLARDKRAHVDRTAVNFLAQLAQIGVWLFAFISYAHLVPALARLGTAWLASVGVISVVLGLAAQNTLSNLIAGISLVLYRPFKVGDRLQVTAPTGLETGVVESLDLGYTVLKTDDNRRVVVPNSAIASQTTINLTGEDPRVFCSVPIGISCDSDIDKPARSCSNWPASIPKRKRFPAARSPSLDPPEWCSLSALGALIPPPPASSKATSWSKLPSASPRRASSCRSRRQP